MLILMEFGIHFPYVGILYTDHIQPPSFLPHHHLTAPFLTHCQHYCIFWLTIFSFHTWNETKVIISKIKILRVLFYHHVFV